MKRETNRLRVVRAEQRITQVALAHKSRVAASRISLIENGWIMPTSTERERLARALKVDIAEVFPTPDAEAVAS